MDSSNEKRGFKSKLVKDITSGQRRATDALKSSLEGTKIYNLADRCTRLSPDERPRFPEIELILKDLKEAGEEAKGAENANQKRKTEMKLSIRKDSGVDKAHKSARVSR